MQVGRLIKHQIDGVGALMCKYQMHLQLVTLSYALLLAVRGTLEH